MVDLKRIFEAPDGARYPLGIMIRFDQGGLDRASHLFVEGSRPRGKVDLPRMAENFGRQDAEKFIERIEHGA